MLQSKQTNNDVFLRELRWAADGVYEAALWVGGNNGHWALLSCDWVCLEELLQSAPLNQPLNLSDFYSVTEGEDAAARFFYISSLFYCDNVQLSIYISSASHKGIQPVLTTDAAILTSFWM